MELVLRAPSLARRAGLEWQDLCNRHEIVTRCDDGLGRVCQWEDSSAMTVCRIFPETGGRLLRHAWSGVASRPAAPASILLPVRGVARLEAVAFVANALRQLAGPDSEVLICEHDVSPRYAQEWPGGIHHMFVQAARGEAFNKSKAMNAGARAARHPRLVLHDADLVPSADYLFRSLTLLDQNWDAVRPVRLLFLLDEDDSRTFMRDGGPRNLGGIANVQQNFPGLATVIRREAYLEIGGHDERFEGWGGEDLEFLDRLRTRKLSPGSFLPAIHLWHPPAEQKKKGHGNAKLLETLLSEPRSQRMEADRKQLERTA